MATMIVPQFVRTVFETNEGRVDVVRFAHKDRGYTFKVFHGAVQKTSRLAETRAQEQENETPVVKKLRNGVVVRGTFDTDGSPMSVFFEGQDENGDSGVVSADNRGNIAICWAGLDLNLSYGQFYELKRLLAGVTVDRLVELGQEWGQAA